jgi:tetratricopeptide (TPR) repeat protein
MECNPQLDAVGAPGNWFAIIVTRIEESCGGALLPGKKITNAAWNLIALSICLSAYSGVVRAQCATQSAAVGQALAPAESEILQRFDEKNWAEVVRLATPLAARSADVDFAYGMALAHLQRWMEARAALLAGHRTCPQQDRFSVELAGIAFQLKRYPESAHWLQNALHINPNDEYANNFAGTVYLLMGNVDAALKYWNRVHKPEVAVMQFDPQLHVQRLILDRAFAFSPAATLYEHNYETTRARLDALGIFPTYNIALNARGDGRFDAQFHAAERNGLGSSYLNALISTFSGVWYQTVYPSYYNISGSATNIESLLRWDSQKQRAWISISAPLHDLPQWRGTLQLDARDENWDIRDSFTGTAPVLGSFDLERQSINASLSGIPSGRLQWSAGAEFSNRRFHNVVPGTALTPALVAAGWELKALGSLHGKVLDVPERRFNITADGSSALARMWALQSQLSGAPHLFGKLQGSATTRWFPQAEGDVYEVQQRLRVGHIFGAAPIDELYLIGMERDTDLWLRGHVGTRDGRKGSSPLANGYFLSNSDFYRRIYANGLISIKAGPLLDIARTSAPASGLQAGQWFYDVGAQAKLTVLGTSVVFTWGHDLRSGNNAFYGTAAQH